jgi:hypothetical protein
MKEKEFKYFWKTLPESTKKWQVDFIFKNCQSNIIHEVNKLFIFKMRHRFWVINKESKHCNFFDTEQEAIDYCLDVYPQSFFNKQLGIFEK